MPRPAWAVVPTDCCPGDAGEGDGARPPLPPEAGPDLPFLPLAPTSPCSFLSHQSCGHPGLRRGSPHSLINDGERGKESREAQGRQPWGGMWLSPAHAQPGLQETFLAAETPQKAVQQPASCSLPRGTWPVQGVVLGSVQIWRFPRYPSRIKGCLLGCKAELDVPSISHYSVFHTAGCKPLVGCEINLVVYSQHFTTTD